MLAFVWVWVNFKPQSSRPLEYQQYILTVSEMCSKCHLDVGQNLATMDNILYSFHCNCIYHKDCLKNKSSCIFHKSPLHDISRFKCKRVKCKNAIKEHESSIFCKLCEQEIITGITRAFTHNQFIFTNNIKKLTVDELKDFVMKKYITEHVAHHFIYESIWNHIFLLIKKSPHFYVDPPPSKEKILESNSHSFGAYVVWFITSFIEEKYNQTSNKKCTIEDILSFIKIHHGIELSNEQKIAFGIQLKLNRSSTFQFVDGSTVRKKTKHNIHNSATLLSCLKNEGSIPIHDLLCEDTDVPNALTTLQNENKCIIANRRCYDIPDRIAKRRKYFPFPLLHDSFTSNTQ